MSHHRHSTAGSRALIAAWMSTCLWLSHLSTAASPGCRNIWPMNGKEGNGRVSTKLENAGKQSAQLLKPGLSVYYL